MTYFSRPTLRKPRNAERSEVNRQPFTYRRRNTISAARPVYIGQHHPGAHYAPVADIIVEPDQLYQPKRRSR